MNVWIPWICVSIIMLGGVSIAPLAVAEPAGEATGDFQFEEVLHVRLLEVEVVVTDRDGNRVEGLRAEDFRVRMGGEILPVDHFEELRDPGTSGDAVSGDDPGTSFLVFLDDYFTERRFRGALLEKMIDEIDSFGRNDRMAVVRFAGRQLELLSPWRSDVDELRAVLTHARGLATLDQVRRNRLHTTSLGHYGSVLAEQVKKATTAVSATLRSMAAAPGRKVLVLISTGWNTGHSYEVGEIEGVPRGRRRGFDFLRQVSDTANLVGFTIYPLHLGLIQGGLTLNAATPTRGFGSAEVTSPMKISSLKYLAAQTGGELRTYAMTVKRPFATVVRDTRAYYNLGLTPSWSGDGGIRQIKVEVLRPGLEVRHRKSFRDLSRREQVSFAAEAALLTGTQGPPLEIYFGAPRGSRLRPLDVPIEVAIPMDWVTLLPVHDGVRVELELRVAALDSRGDRSEMPVIPIRFGGEPPEPGAYAVYETSLKLRRQKQRLVISLYDKLGGAALTSTVEVDSKGRRTGGS